MIAVTGGDAPAQDGPGRAQDAPAQAAPAQAAPAQAAPVPAQGVSGQDAHAQAAPLQAAPVAAQSVPVQVAPDVGPADQGDPGQPAAMRGRPSPWQNCFLSVLFIGVFPLAPVLLELLLESKVTIDSLTLTAAIYAVTVSIASYNAMLFASGFFVAFFECALYGQDITVNPVVDPGATNFHGLIVAGRGQLPPSHVFLICATIVAIFLTLVVERFYRHVINREEFFEFLKYKEHARIKREKRVRFTWRKKDGV
jgi:hypothetical protein